MTEPREATCHCGQLRVATTGEPFIVSICHCLACQRRTGSAFGMQARFNADQVRVTDRYSDFSRVVEHLRQAIAIWDGCRDMAKGDADFDPIRNEPAFVEMTED